MSGTTDQDARALTYLARRLRDETHGCARWDDAGTYAVIARLVGQNLALTIERVTRHAADPEARTPGAIERPFVPDPTKPPTPRRDWPDDAHRCRTCSLDKAGHDRLNANTPTPEVHPWETKRGDLRLPGDQVHAVVAELRDHKASQPPPRPEVETGTEGTERVAGVRAELAARRATTKETA